MPAVPEAAAQSPAVIRKLILDGKLKIESDSEFPIAVDPLDKLRPYITRDDIYFTMSPYTVTIPKGFHFDGASVPAVVWAIQLLMQTLLSLVTLRFLTQSILMQPPNTFYRNLYAAALHDWLYRTQPLDRIVADAAFEAALVHSGTGWLTAKLMFAGVYFFGGRAWRANAAELQKAATAVARQDLVTIADAGLESVTVNGRPKSE